MRRMAVQVAIGCLALASCSRQDARWNEQGDTLLYRFQVQERDAWASIKHSYGADAVLAVSALKRTPDEGFLVRFKDADRCPLVSASEDPAVGAIGLDKDWKIGFVLPALRSRSQAECERFRCSSVLFLRGQHECLTAARVGDVLSIPEVARVDLDE
jgi:hypothetical protein